MPPVRPIGVLLAVDADGYLIPTAGPEKIVAPWSAPVSHLIDHFGASPLVHSLYIRGSIARGTAVAGTSDLDYLVLHRGRTDESLTEVDFKAQFPREFSAVTHVDEMHQAFDGDPGSLAQHVRFLLSCQSACVLGEDLFSGRDRYRPGLDTRLNCRGFDQWLDVRLQQLIASRAPVPRAKCVWTMKWLLRVAFEVVMERDQSYTRDLYPCWERFAHYFPQHAEELAQVLEWALNPISDRTTIAHTVEHVGRVLRDELTRMAYLD